ncbi:MAG: DNA polymerase III subunit delta' [Aliivibrio sp.]|uniref:DNA polymerase III subunit delta' n=1 Tax=Aliivibrio sp. TaxID=1872443 RepID=UPI001A3698D4|nr:DNA polymerase III subunit delta' [Aliivibrio sp.]
MNGKLFPWQQQIWQQWQQLIIQDRLPHALLCSMPDGMGRENIVALLAKTLLCQTPGIEPCGMCHSCELSTSGNHPDLHWLKPEKEGKGINVDQIRLCNHWAWESSQFNGKRVIIIDPADSMNEAAANAILKTLEEPPQSCQFILLSSSQHALLPTIVSRCSSWGLPVVEESMALQWLKEEHDLSASKQAVRVCGGFPLTVVDYYQNKHKAAHETLITKFVDYIDSEQPRFSELMLCMAKDPNRTLLWLSYLLLDVQKVQQGVNSNLVHDDCRAVLEALSMKLTVNQAYQQLKTLNILREQLKSNSGLNSELLISQWLFEF